MEECFNCGISGERALLFEGISDKGIIKVCGKCSFSENIPLIKRPTNFQLKESERKQTVYERLSKVVGIPSDKDVKRVSKDLIEQDNNLRKLIDKNFKERFKAAESKKDLIDNFHWVIMRVRRIRKITPEQLAKSIGESENTIRMAEKGILPQDYHQLIRRIENYLGIKLMKGESAKQKQDLFSKIILEDTPEIFEGRMPKSITISDLQDMKRKKEKNLFGEEFVFNEDLLEEERRNKSEFIGKKDKQGFSLEQKKQSKSF